MFFSSLWKEFPKSLKPVERLNHREVTREKINVDKAFNHIENDLMLPKRKNL